MEANLNLNVFPCFLVLLSDTSVTNPFVLQVEAGVAKGWGQPVILPLTEKVFHPVLHANPSCQRPRLTTCSRPLHPSGFPGKGPACHTGDVSSTPGWGRSSGEGNGNPLQYFCLGNPMHRGAWWAAVHRDHKEPDTTECLNNTTTPFTLSP